MTLTGRRRRSLSLSIGCGLVLALAYRYGSTQLFTGTALLVTVLAVASVIATRLMGTMSSAPNPTPPAQIPPAAPDITVPLWGIMGMADQLLLSPLARQDKELAQSIRRLAQQLNSRNEYPAQPDHVAGGASTYDETIFDLRQLIDNILQSLQVPIKQRTLKYSVQVAADLPAKLQGDAVALRLLLCNFIGDSIRRLPDGGKIRLDIRTTEAEDAFFPQTLLRLELLSQNLAPSPPLADRTAGAPDPGLTSLTRQLLAEMGASHGMETRLGGDSVLRIDLPITIPDEQSLQAAHTKLKDLRVLSITTDDALHALLQAHLGSWQAVQASCRSSLQAFAELIAASNRDAPYDAVLIDIGSLDMPPEQFARMTRQEPTLGAITLIALHSADNPAFADAAYASLFDASLRLPADKTLLFNALHDRQPRDDSHQVTRLIDRYGLTKQASSALDILLATADKTNQMHIRKILERSGHRVYMVENGEQALNALDTTRFDLAIMEMHMPVMSGIEAVKLHRFTHLQGNWMPFIMLVTDADPDALQQCRRADVDACLAGPIKAHELLEQIGRIGQEQTFKPQTAELPNKASAKPQSDAAATQSHQAILGQSTLSELEKLGAGRDFVSNLINNFLQDSDYLLAQMESAYHLHQYQAYIDLAHTFKDSAGNLGALAIYNLSVSASRLSEDDFITEGGGLVKAIRKAFDLTRLALMHYLSGEGDSASRQ